MEKLENKTEDKTFNNCNGNFAMCNDYGNFICPHDLKDFGETPCKYFDQTKWDFSGPKIKHGCSYNNFHLKSN